MGYAYFPWLLSVALLWARGLDSQAAASLPGTSLSVLFWVSVAGLPRGSGARPEASGPLGRALWALALMAPVFVLWGLLEPLQGGLEGGFASLGPVGSVLMGALLGTLLFLAAERARANPSGSRRYAACWLVLVAGVPLFGAATGGAAQVGPATWLSWAGSISPLGWAAGALEGQADWPILPACLCLLLLACARGGGGRGGE